VQPPGKNPKHLSLLSGGEKTLIAISLLFATYNLRPSPFCFLDEIDAALDESNIDRFINLMSHFAQKSQFIVITHNKRTMSMAKTIYGVTMEQPGISKLISMILEKKEEKREGEIIIN
jgi:chromosome segregation protein